jgi:hypothetical protein
MKYSVITQNVQQKGDIILDEQLVHKRTEKYQKEVKPQFKEILELTF